MMNLPICLLFLVSVLSLSAADDVQKEWSEEKCIDADKPLRRIFRQWMYAGALDLFKERMSLLEVTDEPTVRLLLLSCRSHAGAVELMHEQIAILPDIFAALPKLYSRWPTSQHVYPKERYAQRKIQEAGADEQQKTVWKMINDTSTLSLRRMIKIKQAADAVGQHCNDTYLAALLEKLYAFESILAYESKHYVEEVDDSYDWIQYRKGHAYVKPFTCSLAGTIEYYHTPESEALYIRLQRTIAHREVDDSMPFKGQLKELAIAHLQSIYQLFDVVRGCQYGNRVLAAYDPIVLRRALEIKRDIGDMQEYASMADCYDDVNGHLHQPIKDLIVLHDELAQLSTHRAWKYIFCAEKVIERMQEPTKRAERIHIDWQQLCAIEYALADELLLWHPECSLQDTGPEAGVSVQMKRMEEVI